MTKTIEELYQEIATLINDAIAPGWTRAWLTAELAGQSALDMVGRYETADSDAPHTFAPPPRLVRCLAELRQRMKRPEAASWRKAVFHLSPDGQFHLDLEY